MTAAPIIVVGAGHAGGRMIACLRETGYAGALVLIGDEGELPYERPPLSKEVLMNLTTDPAVGQLHNAKYYQDHDIELRLGRRVIDVDTQRKAVSLDDGQSLIYSKLILATGSELQRLDVPGANLSDICYLRSTVDAIKLRAALQEGSKCCVIGAGLIGLEVAASAISRGCEVTIIECADRALSRVVPAEVSEYIQKLHIGHGVDFHFGQEVSEITGDGHVEAVRTSRGQTFLADVVVVGIGATPNENLANMSGIKCENGIVVDEFGRTQAQDVFAVGDVTRFWNPRYYRHQRLESWDHAQHQPECVAKFISGESCAYSPIPWAWTDQYDVNLQLLDGGRHFDRVILRRNPEDGRTVYFGMSGEQIVSAWLINSGRERRPISALIESKESLSDDDLADYRVSLREMASRFGTSNAVN